MAEDKFKALEKFDELELFGELKEMFKLASEEIKDISQVYEPEICHKTIANLLYNVGESSFIYCRFLDGIESVQLTDIPEKNKLNYLYEFNLSLAKGIKELVRLTIFSKLNNLDIHNGYSNLCKNYEVEDFITEDHHLKTIMAFSRFINIQYQVYNNPEISLRPMIYIQAENDFDIPPSELFFKAGKVLNQTFLPVYHRCVFNIVQCCTQLSTSIRLSEKTKDNHVYSEKVLNLWVSIFTLMDVLGHDWDSIQRIYSVIYEKPKTI